MSRSTIAVSITGNSKGLRNALGSGESALAKFGKAAGVISAVAGAAIAAIGVKSIKSANELEQSLGGLRSVFKDSSGQMETWAKGAASSVGLAESEYAKLSTILGAQLKNMGVSMDGLGKQTNELVVLGADLAATFGGSTSDAVSALSSLLRGERDPIERYGVSLKQADINARLAEKGMSGLTGEAAKQANTLVTLELLYEQTADAQGQFARESTTLAGAQQRLFAGIENLSATFGTALLPAVTAVTGALGALVNTLSTSAWFATLTGNVTDASNSFADFVFSVLNGEASLKSIDFGSIFQSLLDGAVNGITSAADWIADGGITTLVNGLLEGRGAFFDAALEVFPAVLEALVVAIPAIVDGLAGMVTQLADLLVAQAPTLLQGAVSLFTSLLAAVVQILPGLVTTIVGLIPVLVQTILSLIPQLLDAAVAAFTALVDAIPVILPPLIQTIVELLPVLVETILGLIPKLLDGAISLFMALVDSIPVILPLLIGAIFDMLPEIISAVIKLIPALLAAAIKLFYSIATAIPEIIPDLIGALIALGPQMFDSLAKLIPQLINSGRDLILGLVDGLLNNSGQVGQVLKDIASNAIEGFKSFLGIASPSKLFAGFGKNTVQGLVKGLDKNARLVDKSLDGISARVAGGFKADIVAPPIAFAGAAPSASAPAGNVYNITLSTLNATAETGRVIVEAIRDYEDAGGRL